MGGSGGGGSYRFSSSDLAKLREEAKARLDQSRRDAEVNSFLQRELVGINARDTELVDDRLSGVEEALEGTLTEFERVLFGGSVAKHTYVDGLSDIDSLVVIDPRVVGDDPPDTVRAKLEENLRRRLQMGDVEDISIGKLAVTIKYRDGMEIQLLPAVEKGGALAISSPDGSSWTQINPKEFTDRLTAVNGKQGNVVVPAIKLAKSIIAENFPEKIRPSGYHIEALAVAAFDSYEGPRTAKAMVQRFFESASAAVLEPISDVTGQSRYVDESLGAAASVQRRALANALGRIARRLEHAESIDDWRALLGD